ncbi:unnamed protein product [Caenorhabditis auriculariae]|uniref:DUF19 domain-containing protein n=1 Tax=Caenorhabditis auriculariae TaxID=2777116 RepID=A0A8S1GTU8_9PELO|nr:unnamed protein product [Caenorhabditis auriculariae]
MCVEARQCPPFSFLPMILLFSLLSIVAVVVDAQPAVDFNPFLNLLRPETMKNMAEIASELSNMASRNVVNNERDVQKTAASPQEVRFTENTRPSEIFGQTLSNLATQSRTAFLDSIDKLEHAQVNTKLSTVSPIIPTQPQVLTPLRPETERQEVPIQTSGPTERDVLGVSTFHHQPKEIRYAEAVKTAVPDPPPIKESIPTGGSNFDSSPFMQIAKKFLQPSRDAPNSEKEQLPQIGLRDLVPNADNNFGLPKGKGCLPFINEFMQAAYGNCQKAADEKAFDTWANELRNAIINGQIDLLGASQETCRRGAERQQCDALRQAIAECDVIASLNIGSQLQRAIKRCDEVSGLVDQVILAFLCT